MLLTDHSNLTIFFNQTSLNARQARQTTFLSEFDFKMKHFKGKENRVANTLTGKMNCVYEIQLSQIQSNLLEIIREASLKDLEYTFLSQQAAEDQKRKNNPTMI